MRPDPQATKKSSTSNQAQHQAPAPRQSRIRSLRPEDVRYNGDSQVPSVSSMFKNARKVAGRAGDAATLLSAGEGALGAHLEPMTRLSSATPTLREQARIAGSGASKVLNHGGNALSALGLVDGAAREIGALSRGSKDGLEHAENLTDMSIAGLGLVAGPWAPVTATAAAAATAGKLLDERFGLSDMVGELGCSDAEPSRGAETVFEAQKSAEILQKKGDEGDVAWKTDLDTEKKKRAQQMAVYRHQELTGKDPRFIPSAAQSRDMVSAGLSERFWRQNVMQAQAQKGLPPQVFNP